MIRGQKGLPLLSGHLSVGSNPRLYSTGLLKACIQKQFSSVPAPIKIPQTKNHQGGNFTNCSQWELLRDVCFIFVVRHSLKRPKC